MEEADSMNDKLSSVRIKKFIDRIFYAYHVWLTKCLTTYITNNMVSTTYA